MTSEDEEKLKLTMCPDLIDTHEILCVVESFDGWVKTRRIAEEMRVEKSKVYGKLGQLHGYFGLERKEDPDDKMAFVWRCPE